MFPGFNNKKRSTISSGDWDRDGKPNRGDCNAMDWRKQDGGEPTFSEWVDRKVPYDKEASRIAGEKRAREMNEELLERRNRELKDRLEQHRLKRKRESEDDRAWNKLTPRQKALAQEGFLDY